MQLKSYIPLFQDNIMEKYEDEFACWKCGNRENIRKIVDIDENGVRITIKCENCFTELIKIKREHGDKRHIVIA